MRLETILKDDKFDKHKKFEYKIWGNNIGCYLNHCLEI